MARVLLLLLIVGLTVYALADAWSADEDDRGGLPRWLWVLLIVLLPLLGSISWIIMRIAARRSGAGPTAGPGSGGRGPKRPSGPAPRRPSGPVAPDDDPEFLWLLEQERRKREREARGSQDAKDAKDDGTESG